MEELDFNRATTYQEWLSIANQLDIKEDRISWRKQDESDIFHSQLLREHINIMREYRSGKEGLKLIDVVQESLSRHSWELNSPELYTQAHSGTKYIISEYFQEIEDSIHFICDNDFVGITDNDKLKIFQE